jgi:hypothetical protein
MPPWIFGDKDAEEDDGEDPDDPTFQRHLEQISRLPRSRRRFVLQMLKTVLQKASR